MIQFLAERKFNQIDVVGYATTMCIVMALGSLWWALLMIPFTALSVFVERTARARQVTNTAAGTAKEQP